MLIVCLAHSGPVGGAVHAAPAAFAAVATPPFLVGHAATVVADVPTVGEIVKQLLVCVAEVLGDDVVGFAELVAGDEHLFHVWCVQDFHAYLAAMAALRRSRMLMAITCAASAPSPVM